ncbi:MAG: phytanoyl-CoA dioxygenase family protein [Deltaproteobacteria bacterium]|nr:phytanoyl-CoA dioxygenase family protein [Deltaproteobacteria bacterium]
MTPRRLTPDERDAFAREGYLVMERALPPDRLGALRAEADHALAWHEGEIAAKKTVDRLNYVGEHYFIPGRSRERPALADYLRSALMVECAKAFVGVEAYLFIELFVLKLPHNRVPFGWHQDHGYVDAYGYGHYAPNLSLWTALDDVTAENGALEVLPFTERRFDAVRAHRQDEHGNFVADFGSAVGTLLPVPAGSVILMSGLLPHRSGLNRSEGVRRAYLCQFSPRPVLDARDRPIQMAVPLLRDGVAVREAEKSR